MRILRTVSFGLLLLLLAGILLLIRTGCLPSFPTNIATWDDKTWTVVGALAGVAAALLAFPPAVGCIFDLLNRRKRRSSPFAIYHARNFDPSIVVNAYNVDGFHEYWPIEADTKIDEALRNHNHILLVGRPHIGKSRAAAHHIRRHFGKWWKCWYVIVPDQQSIDKVSDIRIPRRRYILLLDDVDRCLADSDVTGTGPLQLMHQVRIQARELIVIATMRTTGPVFDAIESREYLLDRWCHIEIRDWSNEEGAKLAKRLGRNLDEMPWDGTPLSIIQPSSLMAACYYQAAPPEKKMLRLLKLFITVGFSYVPRRLLLETSKEEAFSPETDEVIAECAIEKLKHSGFLNRADVQIVPYHRYVEIIDDWEVEPWMFSTLKNVFVSGKWTDQLLVLSRFLAHRNDLEGARDACELAVHLEPNIQRHHYRLGVILTRQGKWAEAEYAFRSAIDLCPRWASALYRLATVLRKQGKNDESFAFVKRARILGEDDPRSRLRLAAIYRLEGHADTAIEELRGILERNKDNAEAWQELGRAFRDLHQWPDAEKAHRKALELKPNWAEAWFGLAEPLRVAKKLGDAEKAYRKAIELGHNIPEVYTYLSKLLQEMDRPDDEIKRTLRDGTEAFPENARLRSFLGTFLSHERNQPQALEQFEIALRYEPSYVEARVGLAAQQRLLSKDDPQLLDRAIENNKRVLEVDPDLPEAHFGLGMCYLNKVYLTSKSESVRYFKLADQSFDKATKLRPDYAAAYYHRAIAINGSDSSRGDAIQCLEKARACGYDPQKVDKLLRILRHGEDRGTASLIT
jgi:tetratricopeptide (TPR) repeat protein